MPVRQTPMKHARKKKPLCEDIGHAWEGTALPDVRQCRRASCRLIQHKHKEVWKDALPTTRKEAVEQAQAPLWE